MTVAVVAGHICLDIIPDLTFLSASQFEKNFQPGRLVQSGPAVLSPGGAVSNTGLALNRLGIDTRLIAKVGADQLGNTLRNCLTDQGLGLDQGIITSANSSTSYSLVISPQGIDRRFIHHPGANDDFCAEDIHTDQIQGAKLFHFGYPPLMKNMYVDNGSQLRDLFRKVKDAGLITSLDMAFPDPNSAAGKVNWRAILRQVLPYVDIFVPSVEEILFMLKWPETGNLSNTLLEAVSGELLEMGTKMVLLKLGDQGLCLRTKDLDTDKDGGLEALKDVHQWSNIKKVAPCFEVDVVGTTGSGDVTVAGFLAALLNGLTPIDSLTFALGVGACSVETSDVLSGIRSWDKTWERINAGWKSKQVSDSLV
jgi:sugar/nucleoside kinase (ribokinase family)